jgi:hypothetical protein
VTVWKRRDLAVGREDWRRVGYPSTAADPRMIKSGPQSTLSGRSLQAAATGASVPEAAVSKMRPKALLTVKARIIKPFPHSNGELHIKLCRRLVPTR